MEENKEIFEIKDIFIKCNKNGDLQLRILPVNVPPYIVDTAFNIKSLLKGKVEITKVDKNDNSKFLEGAKFGLYDENNNLIETLITDKTREGH